MKMNCWLILGTMLSTSVLAQQVTNPPPAAPLEPPPAAVTATNAPVNAPVLTSTNAPASTEAPAAKPEKKAATKKKAAAKKAQPKTVAKKKAPAAELKTVPLVPGPAVVAASNVNVRGQAKLNSEVVTRLTKGDEVTVIEEIVKNNSGPDEPSAWAKIVLPSKAHGWVSKSYIDANNKTVLPKRLKVRSGPGENYSMIGILDRGEAVKEIGAKGDWLEIEAPAKAYAFIAAQYLKQEAPGAIAAAPTTPEKPAEPAPVPATVAEAPPVAPAPAEAPTTPAPEPSATTNVPAPAELAANTDTNAPAPAIEEPLPPRIVQHEGIVRGSTSIQAPSHFALVSPENGRVIDYLFTTSKELDLRRYKGLRIIVTGEEALDERWGNTPVINIQKIQLAE